MIGKVPTQDFDSYIYYFSTPDSIREFLKLMYTIPSPDQLKESFGSFFGAIVKAGILPDGAKRMKIGTMVLADDGDVCFSLVERDIDNYLFAGGIAHKKEPPYPEGDMRADWEIFGGGCRVFVEYFGLMNNADYIQKAKTKGEIAARHGIRLIELFPGTEWKKTIQEGISTEQRPEPSR